MAVTRMKALASAGIVGVALSAAAACTPMSGLTLEQAAHRCQGARRCTSAAVPSRQQPTRVLQARGSSWS